MKYFAEQANKMLAAKSKAAKDVEKKEGTEAKNSGSAGETDAGAKSAASTGEKDNGVKNTSAGAKSAAADGERFAVRVKVNDLYIRSGPGTGYEPKGFIRPGMYTLQRRRAAGESCSPGRDGYILSMQRGCRRRIGIVVMLCGQTVLVCPLFFLYWNGSKYV